MCGIAGIVTFQGREEILNPIRRMTDVLRHRGPDDEGFVFFKKKEKNAWVLGGVDTPKNIYNASLPYTPKETIHQDYEGCTLVLGHRRLSILDLSPTGHQPMCTADERYWIVYNGEIYNYLELKEELIKKGFSFQSTSDTEVLLNAYVHWGKQALNRFVGMFAFAIYDMKKRGLFLARDFFGIKPLYYTVWKDGFAFASEIKALLELPQMSRKVNPQRAYEYLISGLADHGEETIFQEVRQLPAANYIYLDLNHRNNYQPTKYWNIDFSEKTELSFEDAACKVRELFLENMKLHLRSDVPIGAALSGGIDSSSIVMAMRKVQSSHLDINTFSYIAEDSIINEEKWIDIIGKAAGVVPNKVKTSPDELISDLDHLIYIQDEPFGGTSIYAQYRVMKLANEKGIKVMLDGQGADEMLGGYRPYFAARFASLLCQLKLIKACRFLSHLNQYQDYPRLQIFKQSMSYFVPNALRPWAHRVVGRDLLPPWLNKSWLKDNGVKIPPVMKRHGREILRADLHRDLTKQLLIGLLRYEDRNSMAHSIESRVPFLTPSLALFISSLPEEYLIDMKGNSKVVFRKAMKDIVPDLILKRNDKIGFATPEHLWFQNLRPWVESVLNSKAAERVVLLNIPSLQRGLGDVLNGHNEFDFTVWRWINFIRWADQRNVIF